MHELAYTLLYLLAFVCLGKNTHVNKPVNKFNWAEPAFSVNCSCQSVQLGVHWTLYCLL